MDSETIPEELRCIVCDQQLAEDEAIVFGEDRVCADCKENYIQALREGVPLTPANIVRLEAIRNEYLKHEASLKSVGSLFFFGGLILLVTGWVIFAGTYEQGKALYFVSLLLGSGIAALAFFWLWRGFMGLNPAVKVPGTTVAALALIAFPMGTIIGAYAIYLMHSKKGAVVFSEEYREIMAATPHVKYQTPIALKVLLVVLIVVVFAIIGMDLI